MLPPGEGFSGLKETSGVLSVVEVLCTSAAAFFLLPLLGICASTQGLGTALAISTLGSACMGINFLILRSLKSRGVTGVNRLEAFAWLGAPGLLLTMLCAALWVFVH